MRQLHPVGWREHFVDAGLYVQMSNGQPTGETQQWTQHRLPDGALLTRVDWQHANRAEFVLIEAWRGPNAPQVERFDRHVYTPNTPVIRASYHVFPDRLDYTLNRDGDSLSESLTLPAGAVIDPGAAIFGGVFAANTLTPSPGGRDKNDSVRDSSRASGNHHEKFPDGDLSVVTVETATGRPFVDLVSARRAGDDSVTIGSETVAARVYNVEWIRDGAATLWLDDHDVLLRRERGGETIYLTQYVRASEASTR